MDRIAREMDTSAKRKSRQSRWKLLRSLKYTKAVSSLSVSRPLRKSISQPSVTISLMVGRLSVIKSKTSLPQLEQLFQHCFSIKCLFAEHSPYFAHRMHFTGNLFWQGAFDKNKRKKKHKIRQKLIAEF